MESKVMKKLIETFRRLSGLPLTETKKGEGKGCLMLYFDFPSMNEIHDIIEKDDLYGVEDNFGLETEPHCTLLFGFDDSKCTADEVFKSIADVEFPELILSNVSLFENDYDVLKFDVSTEEGVLHKVNNTLRDNFEYENDYPDYHPHCTIAYVNKGEGKKYVEVLKDKTYRVIPKKLVYSDAEKIKTDKQL